MALLVSVSCSSKRSLKSQIVPLINLSYQQVYTCKLVGRCRGAWKRNDWWAPSSACPYKYDLKACTQFLSAYMMVHRQRPNTPPLSLPPFLSYLRLKSEIIFHRLQLPPKEQICSAGQQVCFRGYRAHWRAISRSKGTRSVQRAAEVCVQHVKMVNQLITN